MPLRSVCNVTILLSCPLVLLLAMPSACSRREPTVERTLDFPTDRSLGRLWIVEENHSFLSGSGEVDQGDARGRVRIAVPAGWQLELRVSAQGATNVSGLSRLKAHDLWGLSFHGTPVDDDDLHHLEPLTGLRFLDFSNTKITGAGFAHLQGFGELTTLDLTGSAITDAGLSHVVGLPKLRWLRLDSTTVSDEGLRKLRAVPTLHTLSLNDTAVTAAAVTAFGLALPQCAIEANRLDMRKLFPSRYAR